MSIIDTVVILLYFVIVAMISIWSSKKKQDDTRSYFLANREAPWFAVGAALFASNISGEHFVGLAGSGAASGVAVGQFEWLACFILLIMGWLFVPFYLRTGVFTMPEFLEKRYTRGCGNYLSIVSLLAYIFTKISVCVYAGSIVLNALLGIDIWVGAILLIVATGIYTIIGGLRAVIYTELFQAFILIGGAIILTAISIFKVGGFHSFFHTLPPSFFSVWKPMNHPDFPWTGILFGAPILGVWYWCTDQMIVQRTLAAKDIGHAQRGTIFAGFLKILPVFILVMPGIAGRMLFPDTKPDEIYAKMVNTLLPTGVKGIVVAALLAAIMSSLASVFNSSSTLAVVDFYKHYRKGASEKELVVAGKIATAMLVIIGILWLPFIGIISNQLFVYLQSVQAYISPPIAAVFLAGILWKRANGKGAITTLMVGFLLGASRFILELLVKSGRLTSKLFVYYANINFLHFAAILFLISIVVLVIISALTEKPSPEKLEIFEIKGGEEGYAFAGSRKTNIALSILLAAVVLALWIIFSPLNFKQI